jgi:hypothetical protein
VKTVTRLIVATAELAEAEGKALRLSCARLATSVCLTAMGAVVITAGAALLMLSLYLIVAEQWGAWAGALCAGVLALATGGVAIWASSRAVR